MDTKIFREFANNRILQSIIEIDNGIYPSIPVKMPPFCFLSFNESGIEISGIEPLLNKKKKSPMDYIPYSTIKKIEIGPIKKITVVVFSPGTRINLDLKIFLNDDTYLHFECEDMSMITNLSSLLTIHDIELVDNFELVDIFKNANSSRGAYDYLYDNLDEIAEKKHIDLLRLKQTEN